MRGIGRLVSGPQFHWARSRTVAKSRLSEPTSYVSTEKFADLGGELAFTRPGKSIDRGHIESFNGRGRDE